MKVRGGEINIILREIRKLREEGKRERGEVVESLEGIKKEIEEMKEDLTFRERKIRWILRRFAEEERKKGRAIRVGYGKVWLEGIG